MLPRRLMARPRTSMAMLIILSALHAYHFGLVAAAVGTFQPSAIGGVLPGCTDPDRRLAREATAVCFDPQFASPHDGPFRGTAETTNAERAVTRKTVQGGKYLHSRESSTDSARARFDPASGTHPSGTHPPTPCLHSDHHDHHARSSTSIFGFLLGFAVGLLCAVLSPDKCKCSWTHTRRRDRSSADARKSMLSRYSVALLLLASPSAHTDAMAGAGAGAVSPSPSPSPSPPPPPPSPSPSPLRPGMVASRRLEDEHGGKAGFQPSPDTGPDASPQLEAELVGWNRRDRGQKRNLPLEVPREVPLVTSPEPNPSVSPCAAVCDDVLDKRGVRIKCADIFLFLEAVFLFSIAECAKCIACHDKLESPMPKPIPHQSRSLTAYPIAEPIPHQSRSLTASPLAEPSPSPEQSPWPPPPSPSPPPPSPSPPPPSPSPPPPSPLPPPPSPSPPSPSPPPPSPSSPSPSPSPPPPSPSLLATTFKTKDDLMTAVQAYETDPITAITTYGPIAEWDVSAITDMSELFAAYEGFSYYGGVVASSFNADISNWDTSGVTDMNRMFYVRSARALPGHSLESGPPRARRLRRRRPTPSRPPGRTSSRISCPPFRLGRTRRRSTSRSASTRPASRPCRTCSTCAPRVPWPPQP